MGYFTWKDCQDRRKSVGYDNPVYVICPDNEIIEERSYDGYGIFGRHDIYELVVDWNRGNLGELFDRAYEKAGKFWGYELIPVAHAADESDEKALETEKANKDSIPPFLYGEWKRTVGIALSDLFEKGIVKGNAIKVSLTKPDRPYAGLKMSIGCQ